MSRIRGKDTLPELRVRRALHALGYRYRLHVRGLPGRPDLAFPARRKAIFVHGCFWHGHGCVHGRRRPKSNVAFWTWKASDNAASIRVLMKCGFLIVGEGREFAHGRNEETDEVVLRLDP